MLRYDRPLPELLSAEETDRFIACLTATRSRDRAIVWLLKGGGLRIGEVLGLRLGDINSWVAICEQARQAADTPRVHAHAFRHTYATNLAESGMPLDTLKRVLGHKHPDTLAIS